jgi:hypothetical protein
MLDFFKEMKNLIPQVSDEQLQDKFRNAIIKFLTESTSPEAEEVRNAIQKESSKDG